MHSATAIRFRRRPTRWTALLLVVLGALLPLQAQEPEPAQQPTGQTLMQGKVVDSAGKRGVEGAVVLAYHLSTEQMFRSEPTSSNGSYRIEGLPSGYYDLAVDGPDGLFVGSNVVNVPPGSKAVINFTMTPFGAATATADARQNFPGLDDPTSGTATIMRKGTTKDFWRSPKGVAILAGTGGVILLVIASDSDTQSVSDFIP